MKILASGDHHFDQHSRFEECIRVHANMVEIGRRERVDVFVSAGDIYERASTPRERKAVVEWIVAMAETAPVLIVRGNHDRPYELGLLAQLETRHPVLVVEDARVVHVAGAAFACVAWPDPASIRRAEVELGTENLAQAALQDALRALGAEVSEHGGPRVLVGHLMVDGAITSSGQPLLGQPIRVGLEDLALARVHAGIMGHIHRAATYDVGGVLFSYTGSPFRTDFSQTEPKSFLLLEFDGQTLVRSEQVDSGATPMVHITGAWDETEKTLVAEWVEEEVAGAEVRLRYEVPADQRTPAWALAQDYRREFLACGAKGVKVEEVPVVVRRAKAPEVARAKAIADKLSAHWDAIAWDPGKRRDALLTKARELEELAGEASVAPTWLRVNSFKCRGMGPHRGEFGFELPRDDQPVIAITGRNGNGKTFTLEAAIAGTCRRKMPNQGSLMSRALARDSFQETNVTAGNRTFTIRHDCDAVSGKSSTLVLNEQGLPEYEGTSVKAFDAWAELYLPEPSVLYATQVSLQPGKRARPRFIDLDSAERISVLLKCVGVERLEVMAKEARARRDAAETEVKLAQAKADVAREQVGDFDALREAQRVADDALLEAKSRLEVAEQFLATAEAEQAAVDRENAVRATRKARFVELERLAGELLHKGVELDRERTEQAARAALKAELAALAKSLPALEAKLRSAEEAERRNQVIDTKNTFVTREKTRLAAELGAAEEFFSAAKAELAALQLLAEQAPGLLSDLREWESWKERASALERKHLDVVQEQERELNRQSTVRAEYERAMAEAERLRTEVDELSPAEAASAALPGLRAKLDEALAHRDALVALIETHRSRRLVGAEDRIGLLRKGLEEVVASPSTAAVTATATLTRDDVLVEAAEKTPALLQEAEEQLRSCEAELLQVRADWERTDRLASRLRDLETARKRWSAAAESASQLALQVAAFPPASVYLERSAQLLAESELCQAALLRLEERARKAAQLEGLEERLTAADAREVAGFRRVLYAKDAIETLPPLEELEAVERPSLDELLKAREAAVKLAAIQDRPELDVSLALTQAKAELMKLMTEKNELLAFGVDPLPTVDLSVRRAEVAVTRKTVTEYSAAAAVAASQLQEAKSRAAQLAVICQERDAKSAELADWDRLALDLGRGGIQSAEVDSAGPELTEIANELLRECHGTRFTVAVDTSRLSANGKKQLDEFRLNVLDTVAGGLERDAEEFSGGEKVFLGEVIENALLILACRRADAQNPSIVRDESGAALDPENTRAYFAMLRKVVEKTGAAHLLLVTHSPELQEMCDQRIAIGSPVRGAALEAAQ